MYHVSQVYGYLNAETLEEEFRWCVVIETKIVCECYTKSMTVKISKLLNKEK